MIGGRRKKMNIHIDGDLLRYRCGFAVEKKYYLVELGSDFIPHENKKHANYAVETDGAILWERKEVQPVENCLQIVKEVLNGIKADAESKFTLSTHKVVVYLSGKTNFRDSVATSLPYKGNRDPSHKPTHYRAIGEYLTQVWGAVTVEGQEADDEISIQAMVDFTAGRPYLVVSNDKDLDQIPGWHYDWTKKEFYKVSVREAKTRFFIQLLSGDSTDNIPGLPGIGEVKAAKALEKCQSPAEMIAVCTKMYKDAGKTLDYLFEQAQLVFMLRKRDIKWPETNDSIAFEDAWHA